MSTGIMLPIVLLLFVVTDTKHVAVLVLVFLAMLIHYRQIFSEKKSPALVARILFPLSLFSLLTIRIYLNFASLADYPEWTPSTINILSAIAFFSFIILFFSEKDKLSPDSKNTPSLLPSSGNGEAPPRFFLLLVLGVMVVGVVIRIMKLGDLSLWWDELYTGEQVKNILEYGIPKNPEEGQMYWRGIAYHYFVAFFTYVFQYSEFWIRIPSVIFGMGICFMTFLIALKYDRWIAFAILIFLTFSTYNIEYSRFARFYVMNAFFFLLAIFIIYSAFRNNNRKLKILSLVIGVIMIHTVQLGAFYIFIYFSYFLLDLLEKRDLRRTIWDNLENIFYSFVAMSFILLGNLLKILTGEEKNIYLYELDKSIIQPRQWNYFQWPDIEVLKFFHEYHLPLAFIAIGLIVIFADHERRFLKFIGIIFLSITIAYGILNRGVHGARIYFLWESLAVCIAFFGICFLFKIYHLTPLKKRVALLLTSGILLASITPLFTERLRYSYGADIRGDVFRSTKVALIRSDEKSIYLYLKRQMEEPDLWINVKRRAVYEMDRYPDYILDQNSRWLMSAVSKDQHGVYRNDVGTILINTADDIRKIIMKHPDRRIWITVKGSSLILDGTTHVRKDFMNFLEENIDHIVYRAPDGASIVLLFNEQ